MARQISEITRLDIREALEGIAWWGRLDEVEFLSRLYPLDSLPSTDPRHRTAAEDIVRHRVANDDWPNDWIFTDERFGLADGEDETLLRFLSEMLHPRVQKSQEDAKSLAAQLNKFLRPDGYELVPKDHVSGRPVFGWVHVTSADPSAEVIKERHFTEDVGPLVATLSNLAKLHGSDLELEVLSASRPRLEEPEYDNWDGGTYYYTLTLAVPVEIFARLGDQVSFLEQQIAKRIEQVLRAPDKHRITAVVIQPSLMPRDRLELSRVIAARSDRPDPQFWTPGHFRLFLSHVTSFRQRTAALKQALSRYHISAFVAHDTIDPGKLWQRELEAALRTMDAMAALLTPDFRQSRWTDQEVGWGLGLGVYVLPVRRGLDPYGFLAEVQGIQGFGKKVGEVADEIFVSLIRHQKTRERLLGALLLGFEQSSSSRDAKANLVLVERAGTFPRSMVERLEVAASRNRQISDSPEVLHRLKNFLETAGVAS